MPSWKDEAREIVQRFDSSTYRSISDRGFTMSKDFFVELKGERIEFVDVEDSFISVKDNQLRIDGVVVVDLNEGWYNSEQVSIKGETLLMTLDEYELSEAFFQDTEKEDALHIYSMPTPWWKFW